MPAVFNSKYWNQNVFQKYLETIPRIKQNALLKSGVLRNRSDLKSLLVDQVGGNFINVPIVGRIGGAVQNYDGATTITASGIGSFLQTMIVIGRAKAWQEKDFTFDITGHNFMEDIASQVSNYWDDVDETDLLSVLSGVFGVNTNNFANDHTLDITGGSNGGVMQPDTLNKCIQKAAGANKNIFSAVIMHSQVATGLENQQLLEYWKQTDANGIQRQLNLATWNGKTVMIDDDLVTASYTGAGVYTITVSGTLASGDKIVVNGVTTTLNSTSAASASAAATAVVTALTADTAFNATYSMSRNDGVITCTEKSGKYGSGSPTAAIVSTAGQVAVATATYPTETLTYTTYILGQGAINFCDCGAKVPNETKRDELTDGGIDMLITRQRHLLSPVGFSYINTAKTSPEASDLATAANWAMVTDTTGAFYPSKEIALARIKSLG